MPTYKTPAIILYSRELRDYDRIVTIFTRDHGKLAIKAIGSRRIKSKLNGWLQPFSVGEIMLAKGRRMDTVTGFQIENYFSEVRNNWQRSLAAQGMIELVDAFVPTADPQAFIFDNLLVALQQLTRDPAQALFQWLWFLVVETGHKPDLRAHPSSNPFEIDFEWGFRPELRAFLGKYLSDQGCFAGLVEPDQKLWQQSIDYAEYRIERALNGTRQCYQQLTA